MTLNQIKKAAEIAKARTSDRRWLNAIDRAVEGFGKWIVTELATCIAVTTESGKTYFANGSCQCEAYERSTACKHRALYRLTVIAAEIEEAAPVAVSPTDEELAQDVATSSRANLICEIENIWPRFAPGVPLAVELMARFRVNRLDMLADDMLQAVRLAIAV